MNNSSQKIQNQLKKWYNKGQITKINTKTIKNNESMTVATSISVSVITSININLDELGNSSATSFFQQQQSQYNPFQQQPQFNSFQQQYNLY